MCIRSWWWICKICNWAIDENTRCLKHQITCFYSKLHFGISKVQKHRWNLVLRLLSISEKWFILGSFKLSIDWICTLIWIRKIFQWKKQLVISGMNVFKFVCCHLITFMSELLHSIILKDDAAPSWAKHLRCQR